MNNLLNSITDTFSYFNTQRNPFASGRTQALTVSIDVKEFKKQISLWAQRGDASECRMEARDRILLCLQNHVYGVPTTLSLANLELQDIPPQIGLLTQLKTLDLAGNLITTIPSSIGNLNGLENLVLKCNRIKALPNSIGELKHLQQLDLQANQLTHLPDSISKLEALKVLMLTDNCLAELPLAIGELTQLESLILPRNNLKFLPSGIGSLSQLKEFWVDHNRIESLPFSMTQLRSLSTFGIDRSGASNLVEILRSLPQLASVWVFNADTDTDTDPVPVPRAAVAEYLRCDPTETIAIPLVEAELVQSSSANTSTQSNSEAGGIFQQLAQDPQRMDQLVELLTMPLQRFDSLSSLRPGLRGDRVCAGLYRIFIKLMHLCYINTLLHVLNQTNIALPQRVRQIQIALHAPLPNTFSNSIRAFSAMTEQLIHNMSRSEAQFRLSRFLTPSQFEAVFTKVADLLVTHAAFERAGELSTEAQQSISIARGRAMGIFNRYNVVLGDVGAEEGVVFMQTALILDAFLTADLDEIPSADSPDDVENMCVWVAGKAGVGREPFHGLIQRQQASSRSARLDGTRQLNNLLPEFNFSEGLDHPLPFDQMLEITTLFFQAKGRLRVGRHQEHTVGVQVSQRPFTRYAQHSLRDLLRRSQVHHDNPDTYTIQNNLPLISLRMRNSHELNFFRSDNRQLLDDLYRHCRANWVLPSA
ncbi:MAG: leucine-rich repeat domain-containing protein [Limnobacter sp.]|nr:leucine-rich repeat domain-containing protein [Limnobacter sp.]